MSTSCELTDVALGFLRGGKRRALLLELRLELIELGVREGRLPLQVRLHRREVFRLLTVHVYHRRAVPGEVLLQDVELAVVQELSPTDVVGLNG